MMRTPNLFNEQRIEAEYLRSGNDLGWRLLASPVSTVQGAQMAFIGLNPGGSFDPPEHSRFAPEKGSAYEEESWAGFAPGRSPLQRQVCALFKGLRTEPSEVLAGNLVPFRSASWGSLRNKTSAIQFGTELWREILSRARPKLVIAMGFETRRCLASLLNAREERRISLAWGKVSGARAEFDGGILIGLPHLSRFRVIDRDASQPGLEALFGKCWSV
jgi:hypothetical protein